MNRAPTEPIALTPAKTGTPAATRLQFSLSALMLTMLAIAVACGAIRWLGSIWFVPVGLAGLGTACGIMALCHRPNWRMLKLGYWHFVFWLGLGSAASGLTVHCCLDYNAIAGTDLTHVHIVQISAAALVGPMVGPVANSAAGETPEARWWTAILCVVLLLTVSPFLIIRGAVPWPVAMICWTSFIAASVLWFFGAMISLGVFLS